jgi:ATP-dependent Clp protease ATP-binding subunit ClpC
VATLHVRNVPDALYEALRSRAHLRGRSIANEAITILGENVARGIVHGRPLRFHSGTMVKTPEPRERLSEPSSRALAAASYEAHALGHDAVDTEHVLLALLSESSVVAALQALAVDAKDVREAVERHVERGDSAGPGPRPFAPGAKRVLELALRESLAAGAGIVVPECVLIGLVADDEGLAGRVLRELGIEVAELRRAVLATAPAPAGVPSAWEYRAVALTGSAEAWTEQLNELADDGWQLFELVGEAGEQRAVFRRPRQ